MTVWSKIAHSQLSEMQSYSSRMKPASYPIILELSSIKYTLVCLKQELACVSHFSESPYFLDKACLVKTPKSPF